MDQRSLYGSSSILLWGIRPSRLTDLKQSLDLLRPIFPILKKKNIHAMTCYWLQCSLASGCPDWLQWSSDGATFCPRNPGTVGVPIRQPRGNTTQDVRDDDSKPVTAVPEPTPASPLLLSWNPLPAKFVWATIYSTAEDEFPTWGCCCPPDIFLGKPQQHAWPHRWSYPSIRAEFLRYNYVSLVY